MIQNVSECADALVAVGDTTDRVDQAANICTGPLTGGITGGISACTGDSGGPVAQNGQVIGIVSWVISPCGSVGAPSVHTKVSNYIDFIDANMVQ